MADEQNTHRNSSSGDRPSGSRPGGDRPSGPRTGGDRSSGPRSGGGGYSRGGNDDRGGGRRFGGRRFQRKKVCRFTKEGVVYIDYKNYRLLRDFLTERGKIMPRRITGISAKHQRMLTQAIKRARHMALLPFVSSQ